MKSILLTSLAFLCLASCSNSEVDEAMQANKPSMETRAIVPSFLEWKINGEDQPIALNTYGELAGFRFHATGDVTLTDHMTGISYDVDKYWAKISGGPEWNLTASGQGVLYADTVVEYQGEYYQEGDVIYRIFDDEGNMIEAAVAHNGLITVWHAN